MVFVCVALQFAINLPTMRRWQLFEIWRVSTLKMEAAVLNVDKFAKLSEVTFLALVLFMYHISHLYAYQHTVHPLT